MPFSGRLVAMPASGRDRRRRETSLWPVALIIVIPGLFLAVLVYALRGWDSSISQSHAFHSYGVVHTRLGDATVGCGGDLTYRCNGDVGLRFARQTPEL